MASFLEVKIHEKSPGVQVVTLVGPMDTATHTRFDEQVETILNEETSAIILDMAGVDYISSMGVGSIFKVRKFTKDNNIELVVLNLQPKIVKVLEAVRAMPKEAIFNSIEEIDAYLDEVQKNA